MLTNSEESKLLKIIGTILDVKQRIKVTKNLKITPTTAKNIPNALNPFLITYNQIPNNNPSYNSHPMHHNKV